MAAAPSVAPSGAQHARLTEWLPGKSGTRKPAPAVAGAGFLGAERVGFEPTVPGGTPP